MKQIQWFPGHMAKALRQVKERLKLVDIVFVLIDSRLPKSSINPEIFKTLGSKPALLIFSKMDLADKKELDLWINYYKNMGYSSLPVDSSTGKNIDKIYQYARDVLSAKFARNVNKGIVDNTIRSMIVGIPNVGKSTIINQLTKRKATKTANKPGVTKAQQWVKIADNFELLDTPGILWPKFDDDKIGFNLAVTGAIKDEILPEDDVVKYAIDFLTKYYPNRLKERYDLSSLDMEFIEVLDHIGNARKALTKNGEIDYSRVYKIILTDIRNNKLGGMVFDRFSDV